MMIQLETREGLKPPNTYETVFWGIFVKCDFDVTDFKQDGPFLLTIFNGGK